MPTYWFDATDDNTHPDDPSELYDAPDADALADAEKVRPVTRDAPDAEQAEFATDAEAVDAGVCPWCPNDDDRYEGDHVGRHASSAHPEKWSEYTDN